MVEPLGGGALWKEVRSLVDALESDIVAGQDQKRKR
jgi:hypothetical protein